MFEDIAVSLLNSIWFWIIYCIGFTSFILIIWFRLKKWKMKVIILTHEGENYFILKTKKYYSLKDNCTINEKTYILNKPTYREGDKKVFLFEQDNIEPIRLHEVKVYDSTKTNILFGKEVITQLVRGIQPVNLSVKSFIIILIVVSAIIIFSFVGIPLIFPSHTTSTATSITHTVSTITPRP